MGRCPELGRLDSGEPARHRRSFQCLWARRARPWEAVEMGRPSGTVTFLFTDVEGSTRLWQAAPDAMRRALERHDGIVRDGIESHGGYVFATGGDGFGAAFGRAGDALAAAV